MHTPLRPHLRQPVHKDRRLLAVLLTFQRLEQINGLIQILLDGGFCRVEVEGSDGIKGIGHKAFLSTI